MRSKSRWFVALLLLGTCVALAAACVPITPAAAPATPTSVATSTPTVAVASTPAASTAQATTTSANLTPVTVVMGYIPNVQFAPYFVADKKGYFTQEGLQVKFSWGFETDGVKLVGANQADFAILGGDQVIQARAQDVPLVYVANYYNAFPITIFSLKDKNLKTPKDLVGKKVGLPAFWGATYTGWRALLYGAGIKEEDLKVQDIGFAQVAAITQGVVDAAAGYSNNEPVQMRLAGKDINVIAVSDYSKLVGTGLVTNEKSLAERPQVVQKMVRAVERGVQDTISNPDEALTISVQAIPEAGGQNLPTTKAVLEATIALWKGPKLGYVDPADWAASAKFMKDAGFIKTDIDVTKAYTNKFVP
jgi:NitT/TauT family transport system substrate-binding protein